MKKRTVIFADEGKVLTNGTVYGTQIFLAVGENESDYHEITEAEYNSILVEEEKRHEENI